MMLGDPGDVRKENKEQVFIEHQMLHCFKCVTTFI